MRATDRTVRDLVSGVVRWQRYLDFLIASFYKGDASTLEPAMRTMLRLGLFGLLFSRQPDHAVLNETVEAAKLHVRPGAAGLTNGILRSVLRRLDALPEPKGTAAHRLAVRHSHPDWVVEQWLKRYPETDVLALLEHNNRRPVFGLQVLDGSTEALELLKEAGADVQPSPWMPDFYRTTSLQAIIRAGLMEGSSLIVQDEAAALVVEALAPQPGEDILDVCAAPGSKTVQMAMKVGTSGHVLACDIHPSRLGLVKQNAQRLHLDNVSTQKSDGTHLPAEWDERFDAVLIDAPCSGFGVLSKRADMRWNRSAKDMKELLDLQRKLLDSASNVVKPGGRLIYSTCTIEPEENENQVNTFLSRHPEFSLEPLGDAFPTDLQTQDGMYVSLPQHTGMDGAFAARLRRNNDSLQGF